MNRTDANEQIARENSVINQVEPDAKYAPTMPRNWTAAEPKDDIRAHSQYSKLLKESKEHFKQVKIILHD